MGKNFFCSENGPVTEKLQVLTDFMQVGISSLNMHKMARAISRVEETVIKSSKVISHKNQVK